MALELRLVDADVLDANAEFVAARLDDAIDQQERIAMRQIFQELQMSNEFEGRRWLVHRPAFRHCLSSGAASAIAGAASPEAAPLSTTDATDQGPRD